MRATIVKAAAVLLLLFAAAPPVRAQERVRKTHVFLLDVSLSMRMNGYDRYANLDDWLVRPVLSSSAFAEGDRVLVRWFHERPAQDVRFSERDADRRLNLSGYSPQLVLDHIPRSEQLYGQSTNITQALDLALSDLRGYNVTEDVLIWLLTDNFQHAGSAAAGASTDIRPFYQKIDENRDSFRAAYLFPLINENGARLAAGREAMILYLLHHSAGPSALNTNELAGSVAAKIGNPVITWFPIGKNVVPEPVPTEDGETQVNGDTWVLGAAPEGRPLNFGDIRFQLRSKLRSRFLSGEIRPLDNAELTWPGAVSVTGPPPAEAAPPEPGAAEASDEMPAETPAARPGGRPAGAVPWDVSITPSRLSLAPGEKSKVVYTVSLASDAAPRADSFWTGLVNTHSPPVSGVLTFAIENIRAEVQMDDSAIDYIANRDVIREIIRQSVEQANAQGAADSNRTFSLPVEFRVAYDTGGRRLTAGAGAALLLALFAGVALVLFRKTRYELTTPAGDRVLSLPLVGREYVSLNGGRAAVIARRFGKPTITPLTNYLIDGTAGARILSDGGEDFVVEDQADGKGYALSWRRYRPEARTRRARADDFFD